MSWYRRYWQPGGLYFFTVVTFDRRPLFSMAEARHELHAALRRTQAERPFEIVAIVLLPDHVHCLWGLPGEDCNFATRWRTIKSRFTRGLLAGGYREPQRSVSRRKRQEHAVWQRRFWEHLIRDEEDWQRHLDYLHYNPVKHGYAQRPAAWPYSTFRKYVELGEYGADWGAIEPESLRNWSPPDV